MSINFKKQKTCVKKAFYDGSEEMLKWKKKRKYIFYSNYCLCIFTIMAADILQKTATMTDADTDQDAWDV